MGRLIDADILISELKESALHHCNNPREDSLLQRDRVIVRAQPTVEAIPIPKGATNGDIIKAIFPNFQCEDETEYFHRLMNPNNTEFLKTSKNWWNSPYKGE